MRRRFLAIGFAIFLGLAAATTEAFACPLGCTGWTMLFTVGGDPEDCFQCSYQGDVGYCDDTEPGGQGHATTECTNYQCQNLPGCFECSLTGEVCSAGLTALTLTPAGTVVAAAAGVRRDGAIVSSCGGFVVKFAGSVRRANGTLLGRYRVLFDQATDAVRRIVRASPREPSLVLRV